MIERGKREEEGGEKKKNSRSVADPLGFSAANPSLYYPVPLGCT